MDLFRREVQTDQVLVKQCRRVCACFAFVKPHPLVGCPPKYLDAFVTIYVQI